ncbi:hypothetical protein HYDPIDRAFT_25215 [Hydnomerulius pinastri MD-312]|nr:hypothetical protein HYDPIDRAFT_25215 [Hydnomerulius pinastri MD-312]
MPASSSQQAGFVDPSSLSLPSSSLKRPASPSSSRADSPDAPSVDEPTRKRPRSAVTPEERKEARAHRNRIAAQNSRDRRKAQFSLLERRVAELEEENRRLRAGVPTSPSPSASSVSEPEVATIEHELEQQRKRAEEQRERENEELRERIRTLEKGYEAVVRALGAQGNTPSASASIPTPPATSPAPILSSGRPTSPSQAVSPAALESSGPSASLPHATSLSLTPIFPLSPAPTHSTLVDSPTMFGSDSLEFPLSPAFSLSDLTSSSTTTSLASPKEPLDLSLANHAPTRHLARVATTAVHSAVSLQRVGGERIVTGPARATRCSAVLEDEADSDAVITRLFAEILASPPTGTSALPGTVSSSEDTPSAEMLSTSHTHPETSSLPSSGLGLRMSGIDTGDWAEQVRAEMEMERLLEMLPAVGDISLMAPTDAGLSLGVNLDVDMDFSSALAWDGVSVF